MSKYIIGLMVNVIGFLIGISLSSFLYDWPHGQEQYTNFYLCVAFPLLYSGYLSGVVYYAIIHKD